MSIPIPSDLESAARCLEARFRLLRVPTRTVAPAEWDAARVKIPSFLSQLLEQFSLLGGVLEYRDRRRPYPRLFSFASPSDLASFFDEGSLMKALVEFGYFPFAKESDGSMWVTGPNDVEGPVFLLELPEWRSGTDATERAGVRLREVELSDRQYGGQ